MPFRLPKTKGMLRREAASWLARLEGRDGRANPAFRRWYEADPRHAEAFDRVRSNYEKAGLLRESAIVRSSPTLAAAEPTPRRFAMAAALAAVLLVPVGLLALKTIGAPPFAQTQALLLATQVGEIRSVTLDDGSTLTVDSNSAVRVTIDGEKRLAEVERGRIRFDIKTDERPFTVWAGSMDIHASDASIDVELRGDDVRGQVHRGQASVTRSGSAPAANEIPIAAGEAFEGTASGGVHKIPAPPSGGKWATGMLEFDAAPVSEVVAAANRYSKTQLVVAGEGPTQLKVTGAFRAGDIAGLAGALGDMFGLAVERTGDGNYLVSAGPPSSRTKKKGG
jgi:transmembrane sensor